MLAQVANETYLRATDELATAQEQVVRTQQQSAEARAELELARQGLGEIATTAYRGGAGAVSGLEPFLTAEGFAEAMARSASVHRLGARADEQVERFDALRQVATGAPSGIYHVALYAGGSSRVRAPSPGRSVEEAPLWATDSVIGYGRVL